MQLNAEIEQALNRQINQEMAAAYNYLAMTAHFERMSLTGFAHWTGVQRLEELEHAMKIFGYVHDRGGKVVLGAVDQPKTGYDSVEEVFAAALKQEQANSQSIHDVMKLAKQQDDFATQSFMQWFVDEQVEEEKVVGDALSLVQLAGNDKSALLALNAQFGKRTADE